MGTGHFRGNLLGTGDLSHTKTDHMGGRTRFIGGNVFDTIKLAE